MITPSPTARRVVSLDQFRGYTVAGMILVNFLGGYASVPAWLKHHNTYNSYPDTIMPQFFFAVGFAYRLTFLKRWEREGATAAFAGVVRRCLGLILLGVVLYHLDGRAKTWAELQELGLWGFLSTAFQRDPFQTLVHIGITSIWVLPVIGASASTRGVFLLASAALHVGLSRQFYYEWVMTRPGIDGGPLGFLTWTIPLLVGSLAFDAMAKSDGRAVGKLMTWAVGLMALGYGLSCLGGTMAEPPFVPPSGPVNLWTMSQRAGSVSYLTFASGFSLAVYALFVLACDRGGMQIGLFRTFGRNALAAYILHDIVARAVKPYVPGDAPLWYALAGFGVSFAITYLFVRHLEKNEIYLRL
jgi:predicted acyltransferase